MESFGDVSHTTYVGIENSTINSFWVKPAVLWCMIWCSELEGLRQIGSFSILLTPQLMTTF